MPPQPHPILKQSFAIIDQEIGAHAFTPAEYAILRRVIHSTADFEFKTLIRFSPTVIAKAIAALQQGSPIVTDVSMVTQGIQTLVGQTFQNPILTAVSAAPIAAPGRTRTETGLLHYWQQHPDALYVIGNAPTALLALCDQLSQASNMTLRPSCVIGVPVGFVAVTESKAALAATAVPHIYTAGRKGGSPVAAAIVNALLLLAWEQASGQSVDLNQP